MIQQVAWTLTVCLILFMISVFAYIASQATKEAVEFGPMKDKAYGMRDKFFWGMVVFGVLLIAMTTARLPYSATKGDIKQTDVQVDVEGMQWAWQLSQNEVNVGDTVVFNVSTKDVNHGMGIYDENLKMVAQTQAMPGYTNRLRIKFDKPGTYKLMCMEYCGLAHHGMVSEITVKE